MNSQLELFVDGARIESLEQTIADFGSDVSAALEARIVENEHLRTRIGALESMIMEQYRANSAIGDRLRVLEMRVGIRPKPALPPFALKREMVA